MLRNAYKYIRDNTQLDFRTRAAAMHKLNAMPTSVSLLPLLPSVLPDLCEADTPFLCVVCVCVCVSRLVDYSEYGREPVQADWPRRRPHRQRVWSLPRRFPSLPFFLFTDPTSVTDTRHPFLHAFQHRFKLEAEEGNLPGVSRASW